MKTESCPAQRISLGEGAAVSAFGDILRLRANRQPDRTAYTHLVDGETREIHVTYGELDRQARAIGAWLQSHEGVGQRGLLLYPSGLDYIAAFFGCLYAGAVAIPAYPPRFNRLLSRLEAIVADAQASFALTTRTIFSRIEPVLAQNARLQKLRWVITDEIRDDAAEQWREPSIDTKTLAFIQYTSGSTATPKGVMVTHGNLLHNQELISAAFGQDENSVVVGWLPIYHDMGLIGNVLQPVYTGAKCVLMSPMSFLQRPFRWLSAISRYKATTSGGPNFAYDMCLRKIGPEQRASLDLSSWRVAFNGSEPVREETLKRFAEGFASCGFNEEAFHPCYGLAEATLLVSGGRMGASVSRRLDARALESNRAREAADEETNYRTIVSCGRLPESQRVVIADPLTLAPCAPDEVGEICVSGPSVAAGYWGRTDETEQTFRARLQLEEGHFLRTGDLGFISAGELFVTGRLKDLIIIRGRNHYPSDIELTIERCHSSLRPGGGAAFSVEVAGEEQLVVVQELEYRQRPETTEVVEAIRRAVAEEHELQVYAVALLKPGTLPKTSSGKIQRRACRDAFLEQRLDALALWQAPEASGDGASTNEAPASLRSVEDIIAWLQALVAARLRIQHSPIDIDEPIIHLGMDSMAATDLAHVIENSLGVPLSMVELLHGISISGLAAQLHEQLSSAHPAARNQFSPAPETGVEHPLSFNQQSLWFLHHLAPESPAYNIARAFRLRSALDVTALRRAFQAAVDRHPSLRTVFRSREGVPVQRVLEHAEVCFEETDAAAWDERTLNDLLVEEAHRPFDLEQGPLLRLHLFTRSADDHILLLVVHHIAIDFWSLAVLAHEIGILYGAETNGQTPSLAPLTLQYADYVRWQTEMLEGAEGEALWSYWQRQLTGELPVLNLPIDRPRAPVQTYKGAAHLLKLDAELSRALKRLGQEHGATLYMTLLAAFNALLQRHTNQAEILVGSPAAGRGLASLAGVVGYFVNPVVLRADLSRNPTFTEILDHTRRIVLDAFAHQNFPFALLIERLHPARDASRTPLFQVMFSFQKAHPSYGKGLAAFALGGSEAQMELGDLRLESVALEQRVAQFDLTLTVTEVEEDLAASFEYNTDLFDAETIERMAGHWRLLLEAIVARPETRLADLPLLTDAERALLLRAWNQTQTPYPEDECLHRLFERQAELTPEAIALVFKDERISYRELNRRANALARRLRDLGVRPEMLVGIMLDRSVEMMVAVLGTLKAGAAYVPLDPSYPRERLRFIIEDAGISLLLTRERPGAEVFATVPTNDETAVGPHVVNVDAERESINEENYENPVSVVGPKNLAYVIYTSGSTGVPKGVQVPHGCVVNCLHTLRRQIGIHADDALLAVTTLSFDIATLELLLPLTTGARVVLADHEEASDGTLLAGIIERDTVTVMQATPATWRLLVGAGWRDEGRRLKALSGGEALPRDLADQLLERGVELWNMYGPTETTIWSATHRVESSTGPVPIGRPIGNTQIYILDSHLQPTPIGVPGEVYIGGDGVTRGYLRRPALTAERFVPDPFGIQPGGRLYRTGDVGRYLPDGNILFSGRLDHQIKLRGHRIELGEVEALLDRHEAVREAAVILREDAPGDVRLVAYVVAREGHEADAVVLRRYLQTQLPEYMLPSAFVFLPTLPLTPNGKVNRAALPEPSYDRPEAAGEYVAPRTAVEEVLANIWAEVLRLGRVGAHDNFFELGGHSLLAMQVVSRARDVFRTDLTVRSMFERPTVAGLAETISNSLRDGQAITLAPIRPASVDGDPPLSFEQQRVWFLEQFEPGTPTYNIPAAVRLKGRLDEAQLVRSVNEIIRRHEILRTRFAQGDNGPVQLSEESVELEPQVIDLRHVNEAEREMEVRRLLAAEAQRPFDLTRAPMLRLQLLRLGDDEHVLSLTMHHIASDCWSVGVFIHELKALYDAFIQGKGSPLPPLSIQYKDYVYFQRESLSGVVRERQLDYWRQQLGGPLPFLELPTDRPRPLTPSFHGARCSMMLPADLLESIRAFGRREGATPYMVLLAAFKTLLWRYTGQSDVVVGTPVANRGRAELEGLIGYFANTLVLRTDVSGEPSFGEVVRRVREVTLGAYGHQEVPFEKLVEELRPERSLSHNPLFSVMFVLQNAPMPSLKLTGLELSVMESDTETAKFDITMSALEVGREMMLTIQYRADLFDEATVERMLSHYRNLLESGLADPTRKVSDLQLLGEKERRRILSQWNQSAPLTPPDKCLHELIAEQAERTPDAAAMLYEGGSLTYRELNEKADGLAHRLITSGVEAETRVGVMLERSPEMLVSLLAVLKAGGAYLPLDPEYPEERLSLMVEDAGVKTLLTQKHWGAKASALVADVILLDTDVPVSAPVGGPRVLSSPRNLAYVLYTSGSTGRPKGVAVEHRSVVNYLFWVNEHLFGDRVRSVPFLTSLNFDASLKQLFAPLLRGDAVWLPPADILSRPEALLEPPAAQQHVGLNCVPSLWATLLDVFERGREPVTPPHFSLFLGGERLSGELIKSSFKLFPQLRVWNLYGPTEATANACAAEIKSEDSITIGRPISNTTIYILDSHLQPVPAGVRGELYISGHGLARGYLARPSLTAQRFIPDPFSHSPGSRLYRTGDAARWLSNGEVEFLGRVDEQLKVRGFRVEPAEIEAALCRHPQVREAAVVAQRMERSGTEQLVAYVVCQEGAEEERAIVGELRMYAREVLPGYMVPSAIVVLDSLPLTPNGKLDRKALPEPAASLSAADDGFEPPQSSTEETLARIWTEILGVESVSVNDNFFDAGGHSLMATQLIARVRSTFGADIPLQTFFASPTIRDIARAVDEASLASADTAALDEIFAMLEGIDDAEAQSLLKNERLGEP
jgi:amino acid adenylation domain-containing protein